MPVSTDAHSSIKGSNKLQTEASIHPTVSSLSCFAWYKVNSNSTNGGEQKQAVVFSSKLTREISFKKKSQLHDFSFRNWKIKVTTKLHFTPLCFFQIGESDSVLLRIWNSRTFIISFFVYGKCKHERLVRVFVVNVSEYKLQLFI